MYNRVFAALVVGFAINPCLGAPFVLDDSSASRTSLKPSTLESCLKDAYNGDFHQGSTVQGVAEYTFDPQEDGCYVLEEWHPGSDTTCAKYMSQKVRLDVNYCKGRTAYTFIDQSLNGGRWNVLGALPFYQGWQGKLTIKNEGGLTSCASDNGELCLFAADAFRLRRVPSVGGRCKVPDYIYAESDEETTTALLTTTPAATTTIEASLASTTMEASLAFTTTEASLASQATQTTSLAEDIEVGASAIKLADISGLSEGMLLTISGGGQSETKTIVLVTPDPSRRLASRRLGVSGTVTLDSQLQHSYTQSASIAATSEAQPTIEDFAQTIIDDVDAAAHAAWNWHSMGSESPHLSCGVQGWKQRFLFLDPVLTQETDAPATFVFNPPKDGCYLVEEFHPADVCDKKLSPLVQAKIEYCVGKKTYATLDQTKFGNRWNSVALLPFYKGHPGKVVVHHPQVNGGVAVADAFRFTRVSATCGQAPLKLVEYARLTQHPVSVTLDDRHASTQGATPSPACAKTALDATVQAATEGAASAVFTFVPPSTGCFRVDEFHPQNDQTCALAAKAGVQVDYCIGKSWQGSFSLSTGGGQWNVIGHFPFYAGMPGNITSRREGTDMWVADGFRFTKVSDACSQRPHTALVTLRMVGVDLETSRLPDGQLTTHADLRIAFHEAVAATSALPNENVRLIGLRRGSIIAEFELTGAKNRVLEAVSHIEADLATPATSKLGKTMCDAASAGRDAPVQCHTELMRSEVFEGVETQQPESFSKSSGDESEQSTLTIVLIVAASVVVVASLAVIACMRMRRRRRRNQQETDKAVKAVEVLDKQGKDSWSECGSTATPPSEKISSEVQTEVSGDIFSEIGSQASRECTFEAVPCTPTTPQEAAIPDEIVVHVPRVCDL